ncbi:MAG: hypothetical protein ABIR91_00315 [Candidatus Saccharimonadales bacterium]
MFGPDGLLVGFGWSFWQLYFAYVLLTPVALIIIGVVFESRWVPLNFREQFVTFVVGDLLLAWTAALLSVNNRNGDFKHIPLLVGIGTLLVTSFIAWKMTWDEYQSAVKDERHAYEVRAVLSPTKLYHNIVLYAGYVFVMAMLLIQSSLQGTPFWTIVLLVMPGLGWAVILVAEELFTPDHIRQLRSRKAHVADWKLIWQ